MKRYTLDQIAENLDPDNSEEMLGDLETVMDGVEPYQVQRGATTAWVIYETRAGWWVRSHSETGTNYTNCFGLAERFPSLVDVQKFLDRGGYAPASFEIHPVGSDV